MSEDYQQHDQCQFMNSCLAILSQTREQEDDDYYGPSLDELRKKYEEKAAKSGKPLTDLEPDETAADIPISEIEQKPYIHEPEPDHAITKEDPLPKELSFYRFDERLPFSNEQKEFLDKTEEYNKVFIDLHKQRYAKKVENPDPKSILHPSNRANASYWGEPTPFHES